MLDEHLTRCDILMCLNNGCRESLEKPTDMREHINNEHRRKSTANYSFCYWIIHAKDISIINIFH